VVKNVFDAFPDHQNQVLKKLFFYFWSGLKTYFYAFAILPDHWNKVLKKLLFNVRNG
jgi:hypothetical protein